MRLEQTSIPANAGGGPPERERLRLAGWVARTLDRRAGTPLPADALTKLAAELEARTVPSGAVVFTAGARASGVWIVRQGRVELSVQTDRRRTVVDVLRPGDVEGDIALLLDIPLRYTARALTCCSYLYLPRASFESLLDEHRALARHWLASVAQRTAETQARLLSMLGRPLPAQVAQLLLAEAGDGRVPLAQHKLAAMVGVRRPSLNKLLKDFEREGLIETGYGSIRINDARRLRGIAGGSGNTT
ncbi:MAG: Crp/Fnr family transcriptional regulator [Mycobacteriaceae bacterium]|nr:Crp/Fnr family transcriptional regulator [Mycobacteriaceae bacterium]